MSENEMNSFRFGSENEPSDEMLLQLMKQVAQEANKGNQEASERHFSEMKKNIAKKKAKWADRINNVL